MSEPTETPVTLPGSIPPAPEPMTAEKYDEFVGGRWVTKKSDVKYLDDLFIMATGFAGEAGEVLEKVGDWVELRRVDEVALAKELGDLLFYWTTIARRFFPASHELTPLDPNEPMCEGGLCAGAVRLAAKVGRVVEQLKKHVRDGKLDRAALFVNMRVVLFYIHKLGRFIDYSLDDIRQANVDKLNDRTARGVMRGDGDNR